MGGAVSTHIWLGGSVLGVAGCPESEFRRKGGAAVKIFYDAYLPVFYFNVNNIIIEELDYTWWQGSRHQLTSGWGYFYLHLVGWLCAGGSWLSRE